MSAEVKLYESRKKISSSWQSPKRMLAKKLILSQKIRQRDREGHLRTTSGVTMCIFFFIKIGDRSSLSLRSSLSSSEHHKFSSFSTSQTTTHSHSNPDDTLILICKSSDNGVRCVIEKVVVGTFFSFNGRPFFCSGDFGTG